MSLGAALLKGWGAASSARRAQGSPGSLRCWPAVAHSCSHTALGLCSKLGLSSWVVCCRRQGGEAAAGESLAGRKEGKRQPV